MTVARVLVANRGEIAVRFVGPTAEQIRQMGNKLQARSIRV